MKDFILFIRGVITRVVQEFTLDTIRKVVNTEWVIFLTYFTEKVSNYFSRFKFSQSLFNMLREVEMVLGAVTRSGQEGCRAANPFIPPFSCQLNLFLNKLTALIFYGVLQFLFQSFVDSAVAMLSVFTLFFSS